MAHSLFSRQKKLWLRCISQTARNTEFPCLNHLMLFTPQNTHANNMNNPVTYLKVAHKGIKSRRHLRLVRGQFQATIRHLSHDLQESSMRVFDAIAKKYGSFERY